MDRRVDETDAWPFPEEIYSQVRALTQVLRAGDFVICRTSNEEPRIAFAVSEALSPYDDGDERADSLFAIRIRDDGGNSLDMREGVLQISGTHEILTPLLLFRESTCIEDLTAAEGHQGMTGLQLRFSRRHARGRKRLAS